MPPANVKVPCINFLRELDVTRFFIQDGLRLKAKKSSRLGGYLTTKNTEMKNTKRHRALQFVKNKLTLFYRSPNPCAELCGKKDTKTQQKSRPIYQAALYSFNS